MVLHYGVILYRKKDQVMLGATGEEGGALPQSLRPAEPPLSPFGLTPAH